MTLQALLLNCKTLRQGGACFDRTASWLLLLALKTPAMTMWQSTCSEDCEGALWQRWDMRPPWFTAQATTASPARSGFRQSGLLSPSQLQLDALAASWTLPAWGQVSLYSKAHVRSSAWSFDHSPRVSAFPGIEASESQSRCHQYTRFRSNGTSLPSGWTAHAV